MNKKTNTKRALILSALCMVLCVTMLIGSTFAWFTDNASVNVNKIESGKLDIRLLDGNTANANSLEGKTLTFAKAAGAPADEKVLFEPGAKYALTQAWIYNAGNLHAKYQVQVSGIEGDAALAKYLTVYVGGEEINLATALAQNGVIKENTIAPGAYDTFGAIEIGMDSDVGNEAQGLSMSGISIVVKATQAAVEYDSTNNQYDAAAEYAEVVPVQNQAELTAAIENASADEPVVIALSDATDSYTFPNINVSNKSITFTGSKDTVIDATSHQNQYQRTSGATIIFDGVTVKWNAKNAGLYQGFTHTEKVVYKNCVIYNTQFMAGDADFINCTFEVDSGYDGYHVYGRGAGTLHFTDCTFNSPGRAIMLYQDQTTEIDVVLTNCVFNDNGTYTDAKAAVETGDGTYKTSKFSITATNCTVADGFAANNSTSKLWGNKNSIPADRLSVTIDGTKVY